MAPASRIEASAIASSSAVETPGLAASRSLARVSATTRPAARISRICSGDLSSISRCRTGGSPPVGAKRVYGAHGHVLDRAGGVDADQLALRPVVVDQRRCVARIDLEPLGDRLGLVVVALEE